MESERIRLKTFLHWPSWANQKPEILAKDGFFYTGEIDRVKCVFCLGVLKHWKPSDNPVLEHRLHFPRCPFVCGDYVTNKPLPEYSDTGYNVGTSQPITGQPDMTVEENRLTTFSRWPQYLQQTPRLLANAGFYYHGNEEKRDRVQCGYCKGRLYDWEPDDDPWVEHARCFPHCNYIQLCMGQEFIDDIQNQKRFPLQRRKASSNITKTSHEPEMPPRISNQNRFTLDEHKTSTQIEPAQPRNLAASPPQTLDECMQSVQVEAVLQMGYPKQLVRQAVDARLKSEGCAFSNAEELASMILAEESPDGLQGESQMVMEENKTLAEQYVCKICMENQIRVTFLPCGHLVCCSQCGSVMDECPICRSSISDRVTTFY